MALNDIYLFTVGYTSSDEASLKPNYPIKQKYRQISNTLTPLFPESYQLVSSDKFWFPFDEITVNDESHISYTTGDEFTFDLDAPVRNIVYSSPSTRKTKHQDFPSRTKIIYANEIYEATDFFFNWVDTGFSESLNPYSSSQVRKWRIFDDNPNTWSSFWYEPTQSRFYPLPDTDAINVVPDRNSFAATRWDLFTGDSQGIDLSTFSLRKVDELVSVGSSLESAKTSVRNEEEKIISRIYGATQGSQVSVFSQSATDARDLVDNGYAGSPTTAVVIKSSGGAEGEGGGGTSDTPQMVQTVDGPSGQSLERFVFHYRPNSVNYANIGAEWTEIPRVNNSPLLDFRNFKLMKISFEFLVGDNNNIFTSCDEEIRKLRRMATRPVPVTFLGFDKMFSEHLSYPEFSGGTGVQFAIVDMSITSIQRARAGSGSEPGSGIQQPTGEINRATISITLQELPLETQELVKLPLLPDYKIPKEDGKKDEDGPCRNKYSQTPEALRIVGGVNNYSNFKKYVCGRGITLPPSGGLR